MSCFGFSRFGVGVGPLGELDRVLPDFAVVRGPRRVERQLSELGQLRQLTLTFDLCL